MTVKERAEKLLKAKEMLLAWEKAELKLTTGEEYSVEGMSNKRVGIDGVLKAQERWKAEIKKLENKKTGGAKIGQFIPMG